MSPKDQALDVWGELACFSQPAFKVERFSYPVITPSAARGIYDAIYCKPTEFRWQITRVEVLARPDYIALRRNEVKEKINTGAVLKWLQGKGCPEPIWADGDRDLTGADTKGRTQRQTMALKNVHYHLHAQIRPWPGFEDRLQGFESQFRRRAAHGKCFYQPYFGCREFAAYFELVEPDAPLAQAELLDMDLGWMLYDVFDLSRPGRDEDPPAISLFQARVRAGVLEVPDYLSNAVHRVEGGAHA